MSSRTYFVRSEGKPFAFAEFKVKNLGFLKYTSLYAFIQFSVAKPLGYVKNRLPSYFIIRKCNIEEAFTLFDDVEWDSIGILKLPGRPVNELNEDSGGDEVSNYSYYD
jgi:hypothetical protein